MSEQYLWSEKYRPRKVEQMILPTRLKKQFQAIVDSGAIPNIILSGPPGLGKTTVARAMLDQLDCDYVMFNSSLEGNIDTLRNDITQFATSMSLKGRKYVILDEADNLNAQSTQPALRAFIDQYAHNCGFILTCNHPERLHPALVDSRFVKVELQLTKKETAALSAAFFKRLCEILTAEGVPFDEESVMAAVIKYAPIGGWRKVLTEMQYYAKFGSIDKGVLFSVSEKAMAELIAYIKAKDFSKVRKWISDNNDADFTALMKEFYDNAAKLVSKDTIPLLVLNLGEYLDRATRAPNQEINFAAFLVEVMSDCEWLK